MHETISLLFDARAEQIFEVVQEEVNTAYRQVHPCISGSDEEIDHIAQMHVRLINCVAIKLLTRLTEKLTQHPQFKDMFAMSMLFSPSRSALDRVICAYSREAFQPSVLDEELLSALTEFLSEYIQEELPFAT